MREKWIVETKKGDFNGLSAKLKVSPLAVRCLMNRGVESEQEMREFLYGTLDDLHDPFLMKGMDEAVREIVKAKEQGRKVAIASDFDCDGIFSAYILWKGFQKIGLDSEIFTPDRVKEGYGLNRRIVDEALAGGRDFLVTCDNGIAANEEVDYAKKLGMTVIVTDHHEVQEQMPNADAILDPKRDDETYPFRGLCGAGVAFKLICALYDAQQVPAEAKDELLEYAGIATVADVMELQGENRILVKYGLKALSHTKNIGLRALLKVQELEDKQITAGHIGFILGPCFNAAGRIATVAESFSLLMEEDEEKALEKAERLKEINIRKVQVGDKIYGKIVGVWKKFIRIEVIGIDFIVKAQDLQYGYVEDVSKMYKVNDKIKVIIKEKSEEKKSIKISVKDLLEDPFKNIRKDFTEKGEYLATITGYTDNGIFANIAQGVDTVCILPTWLDRPPFPGEKVIIKIYKIIPEKRKIYSSLIKIMGSDASE